MTYNKNYIKETEVVKTVWCNDKNRSLFDGLELKQGLISIELLL